jgi:hypothetical protein
MVIHRWQNVATGKVATYKRIGNQKKRGNSNIGVASLKGRLSIILLFSQLGWCLVGLRMEELL